MVELNLQIRDGKRDWKSLICQIQQYAQEQGYNKAWVLQEIDYHLGKNKVLKAEILEAMYQAYGEF